MINFTNITNANSTLQMLQQVNVDLTGGVFIMLLVIALFAIMLINFIYYNVSAAFLVAAVFTNLVSGMLWMAGMVPFTIFIVTLVLTPIGAWLTLTKS